MEAEAPQRPSSDRFWRHIEEDAGHDWFYLLSGNNEALTWRLRMIDSAHHAIDMETFLWKGDAGGAKVMSHLLAAADRGVRVRILLDDSFTPHEDLMLAAVDAHPNIDLRIYNPYRIRSGGMVGRTLFNLSDFQRVNHRMHNKTLLVDGWAANVGGRNLADEYFGLHETYNFRDMEVLVMGDSVTGVADHFAAFWNSDWSFPVDQVFDVSSGPDDLVTLREQVGVPKVATESELERLWHSVATSSAAGRARFVADGPPPATSDPEEMRSVELARYIVQSVDEAREEVVLVTAYLVPTEGLMAVVKRAIERGVRVRILTNSMRSNNHLAAYAAYSGYIRELVLEGVEIHEVRIDAVDRNLYMDTPVNEKKLGLHAKFMLLDDDRVLVGSSNLDPRSLVLNTEVGLMIESNALNQRLREAIAVDFLPRNAWSVQLSPQGELTWVGEDETLDAPPADSAFQRLESWFIGLLPVDSQM